MSDIAKLTVIAMADSTGHPPDLPEALSELGGTVLEQRYEVGRMIGAGGMGAVYEARHLRLNRQVAIKVLRPKFAAERAYAQRFLREAKAASAIRHRNVVEILDYGEASGGLLYSVMEHLEGQDLQQLLATCPEGKISWARASDLLIQIASGLKAAHGQKVIHRDIKPANCFLTNEDGEPVVKLVDFGIARFEDGEKEPTLTGTGDILGTPAYIAPELVLAGSPASPRSDIYALGVIAYRMLTGRPPFLEETAFKTLQMACSQPVPSLRTMATDVSPAIEEFVLELLAKDPELRPNDMLAVRQRLLSLRSPTKSDSNTHLRKHTSPTTQTTVSTPVTTEETTIPRNRLNVEIEPRPSEPDLATVHIDPSAIAHDHPDEHSTTATPTTKIREQDSKKESPPGTKLKAVFFGLATLGSVAAFLMISMPSVQPMKESKEAIASREAMAARGRSIVSARDAHEASGPIGDVIQSEEIASSTSASGSPSAQIDNEPSEPLISSREHTDTEVNDNLDLNLERPTVAFLNEPTPARDRTDDQIDNDPYPSNEKLPAEVVGDSATPIEESIAKVIPATDPPLETPVTELVGHAPNHSNSSRKTNASRPRPSRGPSSSRLKRRIYNGIEGFCGTPSKGSSTWTIQVAKTGELTISSPSSGYLHACAEQGIREIRLSRRREATTFNVTLKASPQP